MEVGPISVCVGCGLMVDGGTGFLVVKTLANGGVVCDGNGLHIDARHANSATVSITGDGQVGTPLTASVIRSPDACNGIDLRGNGVWSQALCTVAGTDPRGYSGAVFPVPLIGAGGDYNIINFGGPVTVANPLNCEIRGRWDVQAFGGRVIAQPGFYGYAFLVTNINGAGFGAASPVTFQSMDNRTSAGGDPNGGVVEYYISRHHEENFIIIPALGSVTFEAGIRIHVNTTTASWVDTPEFPRFEFHWHLTPTGVC